MEPSEASEEPCVDCQPPQSEQGGLEPVQSHRLSTSTAGALAPPSSTTEAIAPPQSDSLQPSILIEFCDRCRWAPRATWIQTELFLTFPTPIIRSITLQPLTSPETGGKFRVWLMTEQGSQLVWDRKTEGGFPELKVLKQRVRNIVQPDLNLGHSDVKTKQAKVAISVDPEYNFALFLKVSALLRAETSNRLETCPGYCWLHQQPST